MAFQIRDDVFDYQPDNKSGKDYGNDLKEHVLTLPLIHLLDKSSPLERKKSSGKYDTATMTKKQDNISLTKFMTMGASNMQKTR